MINEARAALEELKRIKGFKAILDKADDDAAELVELLAEVRLIRLYACIYPTDINIVYHFHSGCSRG